METFRRHRAQGFTLIEIIMVLAISSLLMLILLGGYGSTRQRAQFQDGVERVVSLLEQVQTEANSTLNLESGSNNVNRVLLGRAVRFDSSNPEELEIILLTADNSSSLANISAETERTFSIPWGVGFTDDVGTQTDADVVAYTRSLSNGTLNTHVFDLNGGALDVPALYGIGTADTRTATYEFTNPEGFRAVVTVNADTGEVSREYLN